MCDNDEALPITSYACQWKRPKKRKESTMICQATFEKHKYGCMKKENYSAIKEFDPRPPHHHHTAPSLMNNPFEKGCGKGLCVSLLLDPCTCHWSNSTPTKVAVNMPDVEELRKSVLKF